MTYVNEENEDLSDLNHLWKAPEKKELPIGKYLTSIISCKLGKSFSGTRTLTFHLRVNEGSYEGFPLSKQHYLTEKGIPFLFIEVQKTGIDIGEPEHWDEVQLARFEGIQMSVELKKNKGYLNVNFIERLDDPEESLNSREEEESVEWGSE